MSLKLSPDARVCFLTGAGVSVASGLRAYRGPGGLWNTTDVDGLMTAEAMARDPSACWRAHREFALAVRDAQPNAAHRAVAEFARRQRGEVTVLVNLEAPEPQNPYFCDVFVGRAEVLLPELLAE